MWAYNIHFCTQHRPFNLNETFFSWNGKDLAVLLPNNSLLKTSNLGYSRTANTQTLEAFCDNNNTARSPSLTWSSNVSLPHTRSGQYNNFNYLPCLTYSTLPFRSNSACRVGTLHCGDIKAGWPADPWINVKALAGGLCRFTVHMQVLHTWNTAVNFTFPWPLGLARRGNPC